MGSPLKLKRRFRLRNSCNSITGWLPCRMHVSYTAFWRKPLPCCRERSHPRHRSRSTLVTSPRRKCCDRKSRAVCAHTFAPWQQATIEIMLAIFLTIACSRYIYYGVILHAHPVRGESHNQRNTTGEVATADTSRSSLIRERSRWYSANVTEAKLGIPKSSPGDLN